jgi:hypothetical protein
MFGVRTRRQLKSLQERVKKLEEFIELISSPLPYEGYDEWEKELPEQYPEPEPNDNEEFERVLLTLGHY